MYNKKNNFELFESNVQSVREEWIDYNGHMNVAYYTLAFDKALAFFNWWLSADDGSGIEINGTFEFVSSANIEDPDLVIANVF